MLSLPIAKSSKFWQDTLLYFFGNKDLRFLLNEEKHMKVNPNRDKVDWESISVSAQYDNSDVVRSAYESFFNRQDFWERSHAQK